jgi:lipoprotein NlpI/transglutaminase-like putative cysteine protease
MNRLLLALLLACVCATGYAQKTIQTGNFQYAVAKVPAWTESAPSPVLGWTGHSSVRWLLADTQVNLVGPVPVQFTRQRVTARESAGLSQVSELRITFNPAYETLTLHEVGVTRDGRRIDKLPKLKLDLLQRETQLEKSVYDGMLTGFAVIDDVRLNDIVDASYSLRGDNPIFNGKFSDVYTINASVPIDQRRIRIEYPSQRNLQYKAFGIETQPARKAMGANFVVELTVAGLTPIVPEDKTARRTRVYPEFQVTEYATWGEVEAWANTHYRIPERLSPELSEIVERIRREAKTPQDMVAQALSFLQNEIRYFAVATGTSSHKPNSPNDTFARRYGDCKDKTVLTIAVLERLGIQAQPALVSYGRREQVEEWLPTPNAFDHVIARATIDGQIYWLDSTRAYQGRALSRRGFEYFGRALVIGAGSGLTEVVPHTDYEEGLTVTEHFNVKKYSAPVEFTITGRSRGAQAEHIRAYLATKSFDEHAHALEDSVKRNHPGVRRIGLPEVLDDLERNELTIVERYEVSDLFEYANARVTTSVLASTMLNQVEAPQKVTRLTPLGLPYPATIAHRFEFELPFDLPQGSVQPVTVSPPHFAFSYRSSQKVRSIVMEYELRFLRDQVLPAEMPEYLDGLSKARVQMQRQLRFPVFDPDRVERQYAAAVKADERQLKRVPEWMRRHLLRTLASRMSTEAAIASGQLEGSHLANAWVDVAVDRSNSGERDKALEAIEAALKVKSDLGRAYRTRAEILAYSGKFDAAHSEIKQAGPLDIEQGEGLYSLGQILYYLGRYPEALEPLTATARRTAGPIQSYRFLWIYLAAKRAGLDPTGMMKKAGYSGVRPEWPGPIISYLQGSAEEKLLSAAREDPRESPVRLCEAWYFIGQSRLIAGDVSGARTAFEQAVATQIRPYTEYRFSEIELSRMR